MKVTYENTIEILKGKKHPVDISSIKRAYYQINKEELGIEAFPSKAVTNQIRKHLKQGIKQDRVEQVRFAAGSRTSTFRYVSPEVKQKQVKRAAERKELQRLVVVELMMRVGLEKDDAEDMIYGDMVKLSLKQFLKLVS